MIANYLLWRLILGLAPEMTEKFQKERNEYRKVLQVGLRSTRGGGLPETKLE